TSNSLTSGTSIAATVKPKLTAITTNGTHGSADSCEPGRATTRFVTTQNTPSGHAQLATVSAADGRLPLSTHHSPPMPAAMTEMKLSNWYSNRPPLIRI